MKQKAFTLIEVVIVMVIIGLSLSLVSLNFKVLDSLSSKDQLKLAFSDLHEKSILLGTTLSCYISEDEILVFKHQSNNSKEALHFPQLNKAWQGFNKEKAELVLDNGKLIEITQETSSHPIYFFPTGESSGAILRIYANEYIQNIVISQNGELQIENKRR